MHRSILDSVVCGIVSSEKLLEFIEGTQEGLRECPLELLPGCKGVGSGQETVVGLSNKVVANQPHQGKAATRCMALPQEDAEFITGVPVTETGCHRTILQVL